MTQISHIIKTGHSRKEIFQEENDLDQTYIKIESYIRLDSA